MELNRLPFCLLIIGLMIGSTLNAQDHKTTKNGFYFETLLGVSSYGSSEAVTVGETTPAYLTETGFSYGLKLGNKFYFGDESSDFRIGIDANWFGFHGTQVNITNINSFGTGGSYSYNALNFSFVNPGIGVAMKLTDEMGLDANLNFGPNVMVAYSGDLSDGGAGFGLKVGPQVKWHYNILAVGLEYRYSSVLSASSDIDNLRTNLFGVTVGLKF